MKCRYCNEDIGFYTKDKTIGPILNRYTWDGKLVGESDNREFTKYSKIKNRDGKHAFCRHCHKALGLTSKLKKSCQQ